MFFLLGISTKEKELDFRQTTICKSCHAYGSLEAFMIYSYLSLFFIPVFKWNKSYHIRSTCCGNFYSIDKNLGQEIEKGERTIIDESQLHPININNPRMCPSCNYPMEKDFEFCPKCGKKI